MEAKIVFITGASSGIGEGCARKFAREGWNLILNARTVSKLEELKAELEGATGNWLPPLWNHYPKNGRRLMCW